MRTVGMHGMVAVAAAALVGASALGGTPGRAAEPAGRWVLIDSRSQAYPRCPGGSLTDCGAFVTTSPGGGEGSLTMTVSDQSTDGFWTGITTGTFGWSPPPATLRPGDPDPMTVSVALAFEGNRTYAGASMSVGGDHPFAERACSAGTADGFAIVDLVTLERPGSATGGPQSSTAVPGPGRYPDGLQLKVCGKVDGAVNSWLYDYAWQAPGAPEPTRRPAPTPEPTPVPSPTARPTPAPTLTPTPTAGPTPRPTRSLAPGWTDTPAGFDSLTGRVEVSRDPDEVDWVGAMLDQPIQPGDHIRTMKDSSAIISLPDGNTYLLPPETEVIYNGDAPRDSTWELIKGRFLTNARKLLTEGTMDIETGQAVAGIKGTVFVTEAEPGRTVVKVIEGEVEVTAKKSGEAITAGAGDTVVVGDDGTPVPGTFTAADELAAWIPFAATAPKPDWTGEWQTTWGTMRLLELDGRVTGVYDHDEGRIEGEADGGVITGRWSEEPTRKAPEDAGQMRLTLAADGLSFTGAWRYGSKGAWRTDWTGTRVIVPSPAS